MIRLLLLVAIVVVTAGPLRAAFVRARWTDRSPRSAILLWQSLAGACACALVATAVEAVELSTDAATSRRAVTDFSAGRLVSTPGGGTSPEELFVLTAVLIVGTLFVGAICARVVRLARERAERRVVIDLVTTEDANVPGVRVLAHPQPAAFSLAGIRRRVVVSSGTLDLLAADELAALLAHERAHTHARHDLVVLPFCALAAAFPASRALARVHANVALLVELAADDRVLGHVEPAPFVGALCRMAIAAPRAEVVSVADDAPRRVERALAPRRGSRLIASGTSIAAASVVALPILALVVPLGGR